MVTKMSNPKIDVVWEPIPNSSQELALCAPADIVFFDGARGPGKTITQCMRFRARVGLGYGKYWRGVIFDREHDNLSDLVAQTTREFPKFKDGAVFKYSKGDYKWVWKTGEELLFRHVKKIEDYNGFHGHEYPFIGWNEITKYPTRGLYDKFMSVNRCSFNPAKDTPKVKKGTKLVYDTPDEKELPPIPLEVFVTTNPNGPGHNWCKEEFVDPAPPGQLVKKTTEMENFVTGEKIVVTRTQVRIFGNFFENPYIPHKYRANIIAACERDPNLKAAWMHGDWSVNAGGAIDDIWRDNIHVVERFMIPKDWRVDRSFDWGSSHPFATIWWAEANGEEVNLLDGRIWCPPAGTLIAIAEDYGTVKIGSNEGLRLPVNMIAKRIKDIESQLKSELWVQGRIRTGPADNQIRNVMLDDVDTIETQFLDEGIGWTKSDKSAGSRINGLQLMRDRLRASQQKERPGIYFMRNCKACLKTLPSLPRDSDKPDDVDTDSEDHLWDVVRYRILASSNRYATKVQTDWRG